jgi:hypothetical protein
MSTFNEDLRHFLEKKSLYSWVDIELPESIQQFYSLNKIEINCLTCKKSRPFSDKQSGNYGYGISQSLSKYRSDIYSFCFTCDGCSSEKYFWLSRLYGANGVKCSDSGILPHLPHIGGRAACLFK